jgi:hypothetical protein
LLVATVAASAYDAASGRLAQQGYTVTSNGGWERDIRWMPRYVLVQHDPTPTEVGYFSLVIGAEAGNDWKTTCISVPLSADVCNHLGNESSQQLLASFDKPIEGAFQASIAFDDGAQIRMTTPTVNGLSVSRGIASDRKPQSALAGSQGVEIRLPPEAKRIVRVEILAYNPPFYPASAASAYPTGGSAWRAGLRPWIWPLNVAVAAGVVPATTPGGVAGGVGGAPSDATKPAVEGTGPGSPAYEAAFAASAAILAAWAALFGVSVGGAGAPATDPEQVPIGDDGLPLPARPTKGTVIGTPPPAPPEEHWASPLPPPASTDGPASPSTPVDGDGLPLPEPPKVKVAPPPEHWALPQPSPEEHWAQPQPEPAAVDPAVEAAALANMPHTVEREGTGAPATPEPPVPVDPATTAAGLARADELRRAQDEFQAAQAAYDANPLKGWDQQTTARLESARLNLAVAESHQTEVVHDGRRGEPATWSESDLQARDVLKDVAQERQRIDSLPPDQRELASRGVVMAGQGDRTPVDPALAPTDEGQWAKQMQDKIDDLDRKIPLASSQLERNILTTARVDAQARLQIYRDSNYDTEAVNVEASNQAFGVMAKGVEKIVDLGAGTAGQQGQGAFQGPEAPVQLSDGAQNLIARAHIQDEIDALKAGLKGRAGSGPSEPPAGAGASEPPIEGAGGGSPHGSATPEPATRIEQGTPAEQQAATVVEPGPSAGVHDAQTHVDAPAGQANLPPGMARNAYGEIVFTEPTPAQHAIEIEVRNLNIDKQLGKGVSPAYNGDYTKPMSEVRADDIATLRGKGPDFWNNIQDPRQKLYLEQLRDSPNPGLQIDKSMGPAFSPAGPGDELNRQLGGLVKGAGAPVDPKAPTVDVPSAGTPTQDLPNSGPGQTQVLPPGEPRGQVPPRGRP